MTIGDDKYVLWKTCSRASLWGSYAHEPW